MVARIVIAGTSSGAGKTTVASGLIAALAKRGANILDLETRVADSLIGRGVKIHRLPLKPVAHRFMLGDNSEVWIKW